MCKAHRRVYHSTPGSRVIKKKEKKIKKKKKKDHGGEQYHTVEYDPFVKSQLASHNKL